VSASECKRETVVVSSGKKVNLVSYLGRLKVDVAKLLLQMVYESIWSGAIKVKIEFPTENEMK